MTDPTSQEPQALRRSERQLQQDDAPSDLRGALHDIGQRTAFDDADVFVLELSLQLGSPPRAFLKDRGRCRRLFRLLRADPVQHDRYLNSGIALR